MSCLPLAVFANGQLETGQAVFSEMFALDAILFAFPFLSPNEIVWI
jgi:hypothetical protein